MAAVTTTKTVNAAFFQEIKEVHQTLWVKLDRLRGYTSAERLPCEQFNHMANDLCELQDTLAMHFALEEAFGYFDDPVSVAPRLSQQAEKLLSQHGELYTEIVEIVEESLEYFGDRAAPGHKIAAIVQRFRDFDERFLSHEHAENDLILAAFGDDLGGGD